MIAQNSEFYKGRFELRQYCGNFEAALHGFLSDFEIRGFEIGRVSVFEVPIGAEIEFKAQGSASPYHTFVVNMRRTPFSNRHQFNFNVRCLIPMAETAANEIANALELALLDCSHTKNLSRGVGAL